MFSTITRCLLLSWHAASRKRRAFRQEAFSRSQNYYCHFMWFFFVNYLSFPAESLSPLSLASTVMASKHWFFYAKYSQSLFILPFDSVNFENMNSSKRTNNSLVWEQTHHHLMAVVSFCTSKCPTLKQIDSSSGINIERPFQLKLSAISRFLNLNGF